MPRAATAMPSSWSRIAVLLVPTLLVLAHALGFGTIELFQRLDDIYYDARLRLTMPRTLDERIVIVDIDERSLAAVGRWPWGRQVLAQLTHELMTRQQARALAFDVSFPEPDGSSGYATLQRLARTVFAGDARFAQQVDALQATLDYDQVFAEALSGKPVVLGTYFTSDRGGYASGALPAPLLTVAQLGQRAAFVRYDGYGGNLPLLQDAAAGAGHMNPYSDVDGLIRRVPLLAQYHGALYPALSLALFRVLTDRPRVELAWAHGRLSALRLVQGTHEVDVPVSANGTTLIPYRGPAGPTGGSYRYYSAADVVQGKLAPGALAGKVVLVGSTAPGLQDLRATPLSQAYPGVEIHANLLSGLLDGSIAHAPDYALGFEVAELLLLFGVMVLVLPRLGALGQMLLSLGLLSVVIGTNWWLYTTSALVLPVAAAALLTVLLYLTHVSHAFFVESRAKRQLTRLFGTYVPPELVDEMARDPAQYSLAARNCELSVMFCDIRDFTQLSETMPPEALRALVNQVFTLVSDAVRRRRGTLDKFMGDAVMAFWGAPVETAQHAELAVRTALDIEAALRGFNATQQRRGEPTISLGIGINTGTMCVGDMGSNVRRAYTVVGDAVNLASRLEALTRVYGTGTLCGEDTQRAVPGVQWREVDRVRVKGRESAVTVYEPLGDYPEPAAHPGVAESAARADAPEPAARADELNAWHGALAAYRAQHWADADAALARLLQQHPGHALYTLYAQRVHSLRTHPPGADWDGSTRFDHK